MFVGIANGVEFSSKIGIIETGVRLVNYADPDLYMLGVMFKHNVPTKLKNSFHDIPRHQSTTKAPSNQQFPFDNSDGFTWNRDPHMFGLVSHNDTLLS